MTAQADPAFARAYSAYRATQNLSQNPRDVLAAVHEELYRAMAAAKAAYEGGRLDQMCRHTDRCAQILQALRATLDFSMAGADGSRLRRFYYHVLSENNRVLRSGDVSGTFQSLLDLLQPFCSELRLATNVK
jgi:flagellin-specific chaperone FliS